MNKLKYSVIGIFCALTVFFFIPLNFLIKNWSEIDLIYPYITCKIIIATIIFSAIFGSFVFIQSMRTKKIIAAIFCFIGVYVFFQERFIMPNLGQLNGGVYNNMNFIHLIIFEVIFIIISLVLLIKNFKKPQFINAIYKISAFMIVLQSCILFLNPQLYKEINYELNIGDSKSPGLYSFRKFTFYLDKYNVYSKNKNIAVVVVDTLGKETFCNFLEKYPQYKSIFKDFEFYTQATSIAGQTRYAVPAIFSGTELNLYGLNKDPYSDDKYYKEIKRLYSDKTALLQELKRAGYNNYIYPFIAKVFYLSPAFVDNLFEAKNVSNMKKANATYNRLLKNIILFYSMPVVCKKHPHDYITKLTIIKRWNPQLTGIPYYFYTHDNFYRLFKDGIKTSDEEKVFKYYHLYGIHPPFMLDENLNYRDITNEKPDPVVRTLIIHMKWLDNYLKQLKKAGIYDKTAVIILGDHGTSMSYSPLQTENETAYRPMIMSKGFNTTRDTYKIVDDVMPDIADVKDLVLYYAGISDKKFSLKYTKEAKELIDTRKPIEHIKRGPEK